MARFGFLSPLSLSGLVRARAAPSSHAPPLQPDTYKGSFYANPLDDPKNLWPAEDLPGCAGYKEAFETLTRFMVDVGVLVARACGPIVDEVEGLASTKSVEELVATSRASKARLLHYVRPRLVF